MEVEPAALTVHAQIYTASKNELDINGDFTLRDRFHENMKKIFSATGYKPKRILDIGCSTGLSTLKFLDSFPEADIIGIDLSPYMLAGMHFPLSIFHFSYLLRHHSLKISHTLDLYLNQNYT